MKTDGWAIHPPILLNNKQVCCIDYTSAPWLAQWPHRHCRTIMRSWTAKRMTPLMSSRNRISRWYSSIIRTKVRSRAATAMWSDRWSDSMRSMRLGKCSGMWKNASNTMPKSNSIDSTTRPLCTPSWGAMNLNGTQRWSSLCTRAGVGDFLCCRWIVRRRHRRPNKSTTFLLSAMSARLLYSSLGMPLERKMAGPRIKWLNSVDIWHRPKRTLLNELKYSHLSRNYCIQIQCLKTFRKMPKEPDKTGFSHIHQNNNNIQRHLFEVSSTALTNLHSYTHDKQ